MNAPSACPCGGGDFDTCCGPALAGAVWPTTAEALMRSRYTAFAVGDVDHLWRTWHPRTRPAELTLDDAHWTGLVILDVVDGAEWDTDGIVEFEASWRRGKRNGVQRERSTFAKRAGRWLYVDAVD